MSLGLNLTHSRKVIFSNVQNSVIINEPAKAFEMAKELLFFLAASFLIEIGHEDKRARIKGASIRIRYSLFAETTSVFDISLFHACFKSPVISVARGAMSLTRMCSSKRWAPSPAMPRPSMTGTPKAPTKLPSEAPPT